MDLVQQPAKSKDFTLEHSKSLDAALTTPNGLEELLSKKTIIYVPAYNCASTIASVISRIPKLPDTAVFILDNNSKDSTAQIAQNELKNGSCALPGVVVRSSTNHGYAGSQKAAFSILRQIDSVQWVIMLHGDGQYEPVLINRLLPLMNDQTLDVAYGYRSKLEKAEETPLLSYLVIKALSILESLITGQYRKEWHSGFVMYNAKFLRRVKLENLTSTPHIDGNLLFVAGLLKAKVKSVAIYKRYRELTAFEGAARRQYVYDVFRLMWQFRQTKKESIEQDHALSSHNQLNNLMEDFDLANFNQVLN